LREAFQKNMTPANNEPPFHYLERIRMRSVYDRPRRIIGFLFWLTFLAVLLISTPSLYAITSSLFRSEISSPLNYFTTIGLILMTVVYILILVLVRHMALAYFDAVDTLLEANRKKKPDTNHQAQ
jgi:hypothetical protein